MEEVAIITDSSTCLPAELAAPLRIEVLPISAQDGLLDEEVVGPGSDLRLPASVELEELEAANHPFVTEYLAAIERRGSEAVIVTPAIEFAAMYRNAALAAELAEQSVVVLDSRTAAAGQALVTLAGAHHANRGAALHEIVEALQDASRRVELVASLATLEPIRQNGPVAPELLGTAGLVGMRSVFRMHHGNVEPRGESSAEESLAEIARFMRESAPEGAEFSTVFHAGVPDLAARLSDLLGGVDFVSGFSVAMQVHTGRGVVGAAWLPRR